MTPKPDLTTLATIADLLDGPAYGLVADILADLLDEHPRPRDADGEPLPESGELLDRLITDLRRAATGLPT